MTQRRIPINPNLIDISNLGALEAEIARRKKGQTVAEEAAALSASLREFVPAAWPIIEPMTTFTPNWHIDAICDHLEAATAGEIRKLLINIPPRHMKSLTVSVMWPAWIWTRKPHVKFLTGSYGSSLAERDSVKARDLIRSDWYQSHWPQVELKGDVNRATSYENTRTGKRTVTSIGGVGSTGEGGDVLILDDPHKAEEVTSDTFRNRVISWHDGSFAFRWNNPKTGCSVIVMQRLHELDLSGHVLDTGNWTHLCLPARYERSHPFMWPDDPREEEGELLWPAHVPEEALEDIEATMLSFRAAGQLQQRPAALEGEMVKRAWWRFYDPLWLEDGREGDLPRFSQIVMSWDTSVKDRATSDYVAGQAWGVGGADRYLLRIFHERVNLQATKDAMREMYGWANRKWPRAALRILIENAATGPEAAEQLSRELQGIVKIAAKGSKTQRLEAAAPAIESHNCFLPGRLMPDLDIGFSAGGPVIEFVLEMATYPNGAHDDQVDACSQALNWTRAHSGRSSISAPGLDQRVPATGSLAGIDSWDHVGR